MSGKSGLISHNHIHPSLPRQISNIKTQAVEPIHSHSKQKNAFSRDFRVMMITNASKNEGKLMEVRIIIHPLSTGTFPQSQKVILTSPKFDLFFHWNFNCNPFSFRSLVQENHWNLDEDESSKAFLSFGSMLQKRVIECITAPSR
jgi:hypothetical protein